MPNIQNKFRQHIYLICIKHLLRSMLVMPTPCLQDPSCLTPEINMLKVNIKLSDIHRVKFES